MPKIRTINDLLTAEKTSEKLMRQNRELAKRTAALELEKAILERQLNEDPLTTSRGAMIYNRRKKPEDSSYVVLFIDGDNFGTYNKAPGNSTFGDNIIRGLAHILQSVIREKDIIQTKDEIQAYGPDHSAQKDLVMPEVIRNGGDEFMLRLYGCTETAAPEVTERIRCAVESFDWKDYFEKNAPHQLNILGEFPMPFMTISMGYAFVAKPSEEPEQMEKAERYMQMAKLAGGNGIGNILED